MLRQPTESDVRELLLSSGIKFKDKGNYFLILCPFHNEKIPSATIYKNKWLYKCFGCNTVYSFARFYEELKGKPWTEHGSFNIVPTPIKDTMSDTSRQTFEIEEGKITSVYDNSRALEYCRSRDVCDDFMEFFNFQATDLCKFKKRENEEKASIWENRLLIPINFKSEIYNLEGRDFTRKQIPKCLYPKHCKNDICFNQDNLDKTKSLIVCEGIMDIHKIWSKINENVTCTFGASVAEGQKRFLYNAKDLILFIDDDPAGYESVSTFEKFMVEDFKVAVVPGTDPGGAAYEQIEKALYGAVSWVDFLMENVKLFNKSVKSGFSLGGSL